jgi:hypothetical protein
MPRYSGTKNTRKERVLIKLGEIIEANLSREVRIFAVP